MIVMTKDSVRFAHSGPSQRILRGLRPLVSVGPLPLPMSGGGHAFAIAVIPLLIYKKEVGRICQLPVLWIYRINIRRFLRG